MPARIRKTAEGVILNALHLHEEEVVYAYRPLTQLTVLMTALRTWPTLLLAFLLFTGCATEDTFDTDTDADIEAIRAMMQRVEVMWNEVDLDGLYLLLDDNMVQMPPGYEAIEGKEALYKAWKAFLDHNVSTWELTIRDIQVSGDLAYLRGQVREMVTPKAGGEPTIFLGKILYTFRRASDGSWKIATEMWNADF